MASLCEVEREALVSRLMLLSDRPRWECIRALEETDWQILAAMAWFLAKTIREM